MQDAAAQTQQHRHSRTDTAEQTQQNRHSSSIDTADRHSRTDTAEQTQQQHRHSSTDTAGQTHQYRHSSTDTAAQTRLRFHTKRQEGEEPETLSGRSFTERINGAEQRVKGGNRSLSLKLKIFL
ncbi:unnamed protein product [Pleuronectes platessa]|uniref:Uncharacterized protein n=1 Tax=Pleuronectes platessa TaxID=8262 RepID=A0A9N7ZAJ6_PLEPL|nr:unnamed protein product [Pleuronectes platessa]